jgi:hypothetical protein
MRLTRRNGHDRVLRHGREAGPCAEVSVVQIEAEELAGETDPDDAEQSCGERSVSHPGESRRLQAGDSPQAPDPKHGRRDGEQPGDLQGTAHAVQILRRIAYAPHGGENAKRAQALLKEIEEKPEQETAPANAKP